ncbi:membrane or secreted protein [Gracilimonas mengyeensis]|uniref:Cellulase (Glycosyl hydrolase family 5) n=1 Tax=Gracilimonas mengyeensis TaxID=1302730 RepID=A0A521BUB4_9BACT|nr:membrane or secreted protein [Gracilimonas mengyeensis]SMO50070.1 hypothetical protein SAMN06265219_10343 [Gracilimonas mengyeensis]
MNRKLKMKYLGRLSSLLLLFLFGMMSPLAAQNAFHYVDEDGVLRSPDGEEVTYFGVNYSTPFAHSYRALKLLGEDHKAAIDQDVYHFARLGLDAFRIHLWDTEISDSLGNLIPNEHLDLFDYMLAKLEERNIKVILTPLTFYNNAYPDGATPTDGFANYISKGEAPRNEEFYPVIKNYLDQFLNHKNPYTGKTYREDPNIIAMEIINEPSHWGDEQAITDFINEMADHVRDTGWEKPIFYNIAQNPSVVDAVMRAEVDGLTFQWYPGGLVGGETQHQNYMPYVHDYPIPFRDGAGFSGKAMMVYEFDAADTRHTYAYPMMARSFREAGFQWATQFAYDPVPIAPHNSDYPTHFLNLAYSPKRALSMMIASEVFHQVDRRQTFDSFLADTVFGDFRLSHSQNLAELNSGEKFYYTNHTESEPSSPSNLRHIAGAGSSPVVKYRGTGVYFLDKLEEGVWRLEVYPDAVPVSDPFAKPNFSKEVTHILWGEREMEINLPDLGSDFSVSGLNDGNAQLTAAEEGLFKVNPGTYLLTHSSKKNSRPEAETTIGKQNIGLNEFYAPEANTYEQPVVTHQPEKNLLAGEPASIKATVLGVGEREVRVIAAPYGRQGGSFPMEEMKPGIYAAELPADFLTQGQLNYWITIGEEEEQITFPGGHPGYPWAWDYYHEEMWSVPVLPAEAPVQVFSATEDAAELDFAFSPWSSDYQRSLGFDQNTGESYVRVFADSLEGTPDIPGLSVYVGGYLKDRTGESFQTLSLKISGATAARQQLTVVVTDRRGIPYATGIEVTAQTETITLKKEDFEPGKMVLLPRPYPTFLPYWFEPEADGPLDVSEAEIVQVFLNPADNEDLIGKAAGFHMDGIWLHKNE